MIFFIFLVLIIGIIIYAYNNSRFESMHPWQHFFDGMEFSSQDFYNQVAAAIRSRRVNVSFGKESFIQSHIFSARREYLKVTKAEYVFFICAAPFGTGMFVSEWLCIRTETKLNKIPILSKLAGKDRGNKTFYQMDTEAMYRSAIHTALMSVIDDISNSKGVRLLNDFERTIQNMDK